MLTNAFLACFLKNRTPIKFSKNWENHIGRPKKGPLNFRPEKLPPLEKFLRTPLNGTKYFSV